MSLKEELLKANLLNKKDLRRIEHEERVDHQKKGREGREEQVRQRQQEIEQKQEEQRQRDQQLAKQQNQERLDKAKNIRMEDLIKTAQVEEHGPRKFYFVARDKKIPFLQITENLSDKLEKGMLAIVEYNGPNCVEFAIVQRTCAERLLEIDPEVVRFFNRDTRP